MVEILVGHTYMYIIKLHLRCDTETNDRKIQKKIPAILLAGTNRGPVLFLEFRI